MELKQSGVKFIKDGHRYLLGHLDLQGITSGLIKAVCGDYTKYIPEERLEAAQKRGTQIHEDIEMREEGFDYDYYEVNEYIRLVKEQGWQLAASEYIVTDYTHLASPIDKVYEGDIIADIKTSSSIHYPELTLQLSWYATYYKEMNGRKVKKAYVIWLPKEDSGNKCKVEEIKLVAATTIKKLVADYVRGRDVSGYGELFGVAPQKTPVNASNLPINVQEALSGILAHESQIKALKEQIKALEGIREEFSKVAIEYFVQSGEKKIEGEGITLTYIEPTTRVSIDSKALKADHPELYDQYKKESVVRESVRITIKD